MFYSCGFWSPSSQVQGGQNFGWGRSTENVLMWFHIFLYRRRIQWQCSNSWQKYNHSVSICWWSWHLSSRWQDTIGQHLQHHCRGVFEQLQENCQCSKSSRPHHISKDQQAGFQGCSEVSPNSARIFWKHQQKCSHWFWFLLPGNCEGDLYRV